MMQLDKLTLGRMAGELGFVRDTLEKVFRLVDVLKFFEENELLSRALALKGGTAINLTVFDLPRLSVDIDLDYCKGMDRKEMLEDRERITGLVGKYMAASGYKLSTKSRSYHALDSFVFEYVNSGGVKDNIKIEINYMLRCHVLPSEDRVFVTDAFGKPVKVRTVAAIEIFAAKTNALISRAAARDLYDFCNMVDMKLFSDTEDMFRKCIIFYATISAKEVNKDFDTSAIDRIVYSRIKSDLFPVLAVREKFDLEGKKLQAKEYIASLMKPTEAEMDYMKSFMIKEYRPELLFEDAEIVERLRNHPMALWKCKL